MATIREELATGLHSRHRSPVSESKCRQPYDMSPITTEPDSLGAQPEHPHTPSYHYTPLDRATKSIRLLHILPGNSDSSLIQCTVQHFDLITQPIYIALSYMWDHGIEKVTIMCNGMNVEVGQSLHSFLRQFRKVCGDIGAWLWIDALCINQSDVGERNHQVAHLSRSGFGNRLVG
jgi:hypothetical protein